MTTFCGTFNIVIFCVVRSLYLSNDIYNYSHLTENKVCFNAKQNCGFAPDIDKDPSVGPSDPQPQEFTPFGHFEYVTQPSFYMAAKPPYHRNNNWPSRVFSLFLPHACHILLSFYTSNTASCNNVRCNQFKATCQQSKMKIWDAFSYE